MAAPLAQLTPAELANTPSVPPPPGITPNFDGPNNLGNAVIASTSVFVAITLIFMGVRTYAKFKIFGKGSWDDVTCVLGLIGTLAYWILLIIQVKNNGSGRHQWDVPLSIVLKESTYTVSVIAAWLLSLTYIFVKSTFFILYWNIFKPFRWQKYGILGGAILVVIFYGGITLALIIGTSPRPGQLWRDAFYKWLNGEANRIEGQLLGTMGLITDLYILILPISGVLRLQLTPKKKFALVMTFMSGLGTRFVNDLSRDSSGNSVADLSYSSSKIQILNTVECCVGICITCVPSISALLRHGNFNVAPVRSKIDSFVGKVRRSWTRNPSYDSQEAIIRGSKKDGTEGPYRNLKDPAFVADSPEVSAYEMAIPQR
ncbi:hypothetical protein Q9189_001921 [Teloschistes chrysophthalmus]